MLAGRMMVFPLTLTHFLERARTFFGRNEIVSRLPDKTLVRGTYGDFYRRTSKPAAAPATTTVVPRRGRAPEPFVVKPSGRRHWLVGGNGSSG
ncbi:hypothetical protein POL67_46985 [Polyangium sp. rjm3]|uniref:Uncharacterized protein n=1 Tax=Polyangium mundeleinium TaxID=2995306 RepID=A0ABT5F5T8_9BACT|nr:hypothetical protein [Polyangium mundeleinium]MDC0748964.1 hypothetical protein [Polyangium mundeleinium]